MMPVVFGLAIMVVSETATLARIEPFWSWNTPIAWTGFILFADGIVRRARGESWLTTSPREFAVLAAVSIPLWLVFELFNLYLRNWYYVGLPENLALRYFGYAWAYATIWPAIFEAADLVSVLRDSRRSKPPTGGPHEWMKSTSMLSIIAGLLMLLAPFFVSPSVARYLAAPVWLGFIFLLDPINARLGAPSLLAEWRGRTFDRTINLALAGVLCGLLWEFWNYWCRAKWHYTVPIFERVKLFEMPVAGYLGFPAFALECFVMYVFLRRIVAGHLGRRIGL